VRARCLTASVFLGVSLLVVGACGGSDDATGNGSTTSTRLPSSTTPSSTTPPTSAPPSSSSTTFTPYADATAEVRALVPGARGTSVAQLAEQIAAALRTGGTRAVSVASVQSGEPSIAMISVRGGDDSVAGADYRITFEGDETGWAIASAEKRYACVRGVEDGVCV